MLAKTSLTRVYIVVLRHNRYQRLAVRGPNEGILENVIGSIKQAEIARVSVGFFHLWEFQKIANEVIDN